MRTDAESAARSGDVNALRALHQFSGAGSLSAANADGVTPAHAAAQNGHDGCLRALHELGAASSLSAAIADGVTPAHSAAQHGHDGCLRVLHELGAASSLSAADADGVTPAHAAARHGHDGCLRVLYELLSVIIAPQLQYLQTVDASGIAGVISELKEKMALAWSPEIISTPAEIAAFYDHVGCFEVLTEIGGAAAFWAKLAASPLLMKEWMLSKPTLLDLPNKRAWMHRCTAAKVSVSNAVTLSLVASRANVLDGLCAQLGVNEATGELISGTGASALDVRWEGEAASGDALRRDWFGLATAEMLSLDRGLFVESHDKLTLRPNPDSATAAGDDHLSYFALLGRIAGLALYHREPLNASWSTAFIKTAFGYSISVEDVQVEDPCLYASLKETLSGSAEYLGMLCKTFVIESEEADYMHSGATKRRRSIELKPGGEEIDVTAENVGEYVQLYAKQSLVGGYCHQVAAFRSGLAVFFDDELLTKLRTCCTVADVQLLLCGAPDIDMDDWIKNTRYDPPEYANSNQVRWFWALVRSMTTEERSRLLYFCTGSMRPPATGFGSLMGYNGQEDEQFTIASIDGAEAGRLPTAAACFNKLNLPAYPTENELRAKLNSALIESEGFNEGAVAV